MTSPVKVLCDHRNRLPIVRDQGRRPLCLPFAVSDANAFSNSSLESFSVEFLAYQASIATPCGAGNEGLTFAAVTQAVKKPGQPLETEFPYDRLHPSPIKQPTAEQQNPKELFTTQLSEGVPNIRTLMDDLRMDQLYVLGIRVPGSFINSTNSSIFDADSEQLGNHAVLAVGYGELNTGGSVILVKNSWGQEWGEQGFGWITENLYNERTILAAKLEV